MSYIIGFVSAKGYMSRFPLNLINTIQIIKLFFYINRPKKYGTYVSCPFKI